MASTSFDPSSLFNVEGLIVVVTGGGSGIGLVLAQALEANGAIVYILGRRRETLDTATKTAKRGNLYSIQCDVTSKSDLEHAAAEVKSKHGYVNVVIANSGIAGPTVDGIPENASFSEYRNHLWSWDSDEFNKTYAINTTGVFYTVAAFLELLDAGNKQCGLKQRSQVIATSSIGAYFRQPVVGFAYESSKAAVSHIMKQFATSLVPYGIRANVIAPGWYPSELTTDIIKRQNEIGWKKDFVPEERPGDEEDLAGAILFLVSKAGAYINGNALITDGGRLGILPATY